MPETFRYAVPHGICSCLTLARVVKVQSKHLSDNDVRQLASLLPFITNSHQLTFDPRADALKVAESIERLIDDLELRCTLREYDVPQADLQGIIERALPTGKEDVRYQEFVEQLQSIY